MRVRSRTAPGRRAEGRFARTVAEEVEHGIVWADYRSKLSPFLMPGPADTPEAAMWAIQRARDHELSMDAIDTGIPGTAPRWPHWRGTACWPATARADRA